VVLTDGFNAKSASFHSTLPEESLMKSAYLARVASRVSSHDVSANKGVFFYSRIDISCSRAP